MPAPQGFGRPLLVPDSAFATPFCRPLLSRTLSRGRVGLRTTAGGYMGQSDFLAHAAECERALQVARDADRRSGLELLRKAWLTLAHDQQPARDPEMQEAASALRRLHGHMIAARATLH